MGEPSSEDTAPQPWAAARARAVRRARLELATVSLLFALAGAFAVQLGFWVLGAHGVRKSETPLVSAAASHRVRN